MRWETAETREALADLLAAKVAKALCEAVETRGRASLAVPGGTTPGPFLTRLGQSEVPWEQVAVTLTDERWVPVSSERSNQALLAKTLFAGFAASAEFVPLYTATPGPADGLPSVETALRQIVLPLDVAVLGMGEDGHTASLFPGAIGTEAALDPAGERVVAEITAAGQPEPRVTLTAPALSAARTLCLLIHGEAKRRVLETAAEDAPIRAVLDRARGEPLVFHAP